MGNLLGDFRYALRSLARQPTFASVAILTLVLGIGTNTAIFSVIKAVLLNQLPYQDASRLVVVREQNPDGSTDMVAPLTYLDWKEQSRSVPAMTAFRPLRYACQRDARPNVLGGRRDAGRGPRRRSEPRVLGAALRRIAERH